MATYNRNGWLDTAMDQVRCKPEHKAIRAELLGHIEDKEQYFLDSGMEPTQAGRAAIEAMGDPVEVGKELDKAHPVFWGKLYTALKVVITLLCIVVFFCVVDFADKNDITTILLQNYPLKVKQTDPYKLGGEDVLVLDVDQKPIKHSGYTIEVTQAYWSSQMYTGAENVLEVNIKVSNPRPWAVSPLFMGRLRRTDKEDAALVIGVGLPNGGRINHSIDVLQKSSGEQIKGYILDAWHNNLEDYRCWDTWYFTLEVYNVERGDTVTLYHPDHEELAMTFDVGVAG